MLDLASRRELRRLASLNELLAVALLRGKRCAFAEHADDYDRLVGRKSTGTVRSLLQELLDLQRRALECIGDQQGCDEHVGHARLSRAPMQCASSPKDLAQMVGLVLELRRFANLGQRLLFLRHGDEQTRAARA